jgi:hypothetical protein
MARRHPGRRTPTKPLPIDNDAPSLGSYTPTTTPTEPPVRLYGQADGATVCTACGDWRLGDRVAEFGTCWACGSSTLVHKPVLLCPAGCGYLLDEEVAKHVSLYLHYSMLHHDFSMYDWHLPTESYHPVPEALLATCASTHTPAMHHPTCGPGAQCRTKQPTPEPEAEEPDVPPPHLPASPQAQAHGYTPQR